MNIFNILQFPSINIVVAVNTLRKKCPYLELFWSAFFPHFPAFGLNTERYSVSLRIQSECGKMRTRITLNTGTFYTVILFEKMVLNIAFFKDFLHIILLTDLLMIFWGFPWKHLDKRISLLSSKKIGYIVLLQTLCFPVIAFFLSVTTPYIWGTWTELNEFSQTP